MIRPKRRRKAYVQKKRARIHQNASNQAAAAVHNIQRDKHSQSLSSRRTVGSSNTATGKTPRTKQKAVKAVKGRHSKWSRAGRASFKGSAAGGATCREIIGADRGAEAAGDFGAARRRQHRPL